ncbi:MAG: hypothetical protein Q9171_002500 [Xanthocarpia ochracea]
MTCSDLPTEVLLLIFECCPDISTAVSLAQVSKDFNGTWMAYKKSICEEILARTIECYEEAKCSVAAEELEIHLDKDSAVGGIPDIDHEWWASFEGVVQFLGVEQFTLLVLRHEKEAKRALDVVARTPSLFYLEDGTDSTLSADRVVDGLFCTNPTERQRFIQAFYNMQTLSAIIQKRGYSDDPGHLLEATNDQGVFRIFEVARTLCHETSEDTQDQMGMDMGFHPMENLHPHELPDPNPWEAASRSLRLEALMRSNGSQNDITGWFWKLRVILDDYQHALGPG